jgi:hypothetical protein
MFDPYSRYADVPTLSHTLEDGRTVRYKARRLCPPGESLQTFSEATVTAEDRPDLLAFRTLGVSQLFWRLCDANDVLEPAELTAQIGRRLRIPVPQL